MSRNSRVGRKIPNKQTKKSPALWQDWSKLILEKISFKSCQCILTMSGFFSFEKGYVLSFEQILPRAALCLVWLRRAQWF